MIKVDIFRASKDYRVHRNGTFTEGRLYYGRRSYRGDSYLILSNEGEWIPMFMYNMTIFSRVRDFNKRFEKRFSTIVRNKEEVKALPDTDNLIMLDSSE